MKYTKLSHNVYELQHATFKRALRYKLAEYLAMEYLKEIKNIRRHWLALSPLIGMVVCFVAAMIASI